MLRAIRRQARKAAETAPEARRDCQNACGAAAGRSTDGRGRRDWETPSKKKWQTFSGRQAPNRKPVTSAGKRVTSRRSATRAHYRESVPPRHSGGADTEGAAGLVENESQREQRCDYTARIVVWTSRAVEKHIPRDRAVSGDCTPGKVMLAMPIFNARRIACETMMGVMSMHGACGGSDRATLDAFGDSNIAHCRQRHRALFQAATDCGHIIFPGQRYGLHGGRLRFCA